MTAHKHRFLGPTPQISRRGFIAGAGAMALAVVPGISPAVGINRSAASWKMKLSTSSLHYRGLSIREACRRIGELGFQAIDVWSHFTWAGPLCEHLEDALNKIGPDQFAELLSENKLKLGAATCYSAPFSRFAKKLGQLGGCVVIRGSGQLRTDEGSKDVGQLTRQMKQFFESLKPDLELAEKYNCVLAIENHSGRALLNRLDSIKAFTDLNTNKRLGIALAPYHIQLNGESVVEAIRLASLQLRFFYAWQYGEGTEQLPGIGKTDVSPWLRALAAIDYAGYVNPFMHHEPKPDAMSRALQASRAYLEASYRKAVS